LKKNYLIIIGGPTAVGKTAMAIRLAKAFETVILSADSRQFYRGMDIGTAKPSTAELETVKHHFINHLDITADYSIGDFEKDALACLDNIFLEKNIAIMVGGSGMYISAVCEGLDFFPTVSDETKEKLAKIHEEKGLAALQDLLKEKDPESYEVLDIQNPVRVLRALGVTLSGEKPFSFYKKQAKPSRNFIPIYIALEDERSTLYARIEQRVDKMFTDGLEAEARFFYPHRTKNALQTVGYQELFELFEEKINRERAIELIKQHSRKRQLTWFKNKANYTFFSPKDDEKIINFIKNNYLRAEN
jgi:tRNA dimethylallyltransferase